MNTNKIKITTLVIFCVILLTFLPTDTAANSILTQYTWSRTVTNHPNRVMQWYNEVICILVNCKENKWFLGENLIDLGVPYINFTYTPNLSEVIRGIDLGVSVQTHDGNTIMYMGDAGRYKDANGVVHSWGNPSLTNCGVVNDCSPGSNFVGECSQCNDPIAIIVDNDGPKNGIDAKLLLDPNNPRKFWPLLIPGVNTSGYAGHSLPSEIFKPFNQPTGAETGLVVWGNQSNYNLVYPVYLWFVSGLKSGAKNDPRPIPQSYLTCSYDGVSFDVCPNPTWGYKPFPVEFSQDKFIFVSPVMIPDVWNLIDEGKSCTLCKLKPKLKTYWFGHSPGMLLYGASGGEKNNSAQDLWGYRESPLYLAYMELQSLDVWYFTGDGWSSVESDAVPIMSYEGHPPDEQKNYWFGEFSLKLIPTKDIENMRLVLLSNHPGRKILYRTASLLNPDKWAEPQLTCAVGYGPYIIDKYTEIKDGRLIMYHTIDGWNGNPNPFLHEPYGVFTAQLRLRQDPTNVNSPCGKAPIWPPQP